MKRFTTVICSVCFLILGISLTYDKSPVKFKTGGLPVMASNVNSTLPFDVFMDRIKNSQVKSDTVYLPEHTDTIYLPGKTVTKWKVRYVSTHNKPQGSCISPMPNSVKSESMVREEKTKDIVDTSRVSSIQLKVDGKVVYSKNDNHSTSVTPQ
jgi:hypothetical protein